jgi:hypothetical protein
MHSWTQELFLFLGNVVVHWQALLTGGVVMAAVGAYERRKSREISWQSYVFIACVFLFYSFFAAWQDEHHDATAIINDKASLAGGLATCQSDFKVQQTYSKGLETVNRNQQQTIDGQHQTVDQNQVTINRCVVSLGKMNPVINTRINVIAAHVRKVQQQNQFGPPTDMNLFEIIIMTNHQSEPKGLLHCEQPFRLMSQAELSGTLTMNFTDPSNQIAVSTDHQITVNQLGALWEDENPILVSAAADRESLGHCNFKLQ